MGPYGKVCGKLSRLSPGLLASLSPFLPSFQLLVLSPFSSFIDPPFRSQVCLEVSLFVRRGSLVSTYLDHFTPSDVSSIKTGLVYGGGDGTENVSTSGFAVQEKYFLLRTSRIFILNDNPDWIFSQNKQNMNRNAGLFSGG